MCGRFIQIVNPERIRLILPGIELDSKALTDFRPRFNVAPTTRIMAVINTKAPTATVVRWGLIPHWHKGDRTPRPLINARAETLRDKPSFRDSFRSRRCLIFADGFYEWKRDTTPKTPYVIRMKSREPFAMAGLWDTWTDLSSHARITSCAIVTTRSNGLIGAIHDRMPVILDPEAFMLWLSPDEIHPEELGHLLGPYPEEGMEAYPVSRRVNDPSWDTKECMEPLGPSYAGEPSP